MIPAKTIISAIGVGFLVMPGMAVFALLWTRQHRRSMKQPGLSDDQVQRAKARYRAAMTICVAMGVVFTLPWYAALQMFRFDWRRNDAASIQVEEYVYERYERRKLRTVILDDPADVERVLRAVEGMEAAPGVNHEGGPKREYVVRLCRRSGLLSPYSISIQLGPKGRPFSEFRQYLMSVDFDSSTLNRGYYQSDVLVRLIKQRLGDDGEKPPS